MYNRKTIDTWILYLDIILGYYTWIMDKDGKKKLQNYRGVI